MTDAHYTPSWPGATPAAEIILTYVAATIPGPAWVDGSMLADMAAVGLRPEDVTAAVAELADAGRLVLHQCMGITGLVLPVPGPPGRPPRPARTPRTTAATPDDWLHTVMAAGWVPRLSGTAVALLYALRTRADARLNVAASIPTLVGDVGRSIRSVTKALRRLDVLGLAVVVQPGGGGHTAVRELRAVAARRLAVDAEGGGQ